MSVGMLAKAVAILEHLRRRPGLYVNPVQITTVRSYLHGFRAALAACGLDIPAEVYEQTAKSRGWKPRATGIVWHMQAKGLDETSVIEELISIESEALRRAVGSVDAK